MDLDLAGVGFIDSTVITALVTARSAAAERGSRLTVTNPASQVRHILGAAAEATLCNAGSAASYGALGSS